MIACICVALWALSMWLVMFLIKEQVATTERLRQRVEVLDTHAREVDRRLDQQQHDVENLHFEVLG